MQKQLSEQEKRAIFTALKTALTTKAEVVFGSVILSINHETFAVTVKKDGCVRSNFFVKPVKKLAHARVNDPIGQHVLGMIAWVGNMIQVLHREVEAQESHATQSAN